MARTVAIVEDDAAIRANYADMLKKHGYQVSAYADRKTATAGFRTRLPDLALLDIGLADEPDGGFTLCRELRAMSAALPIIFLTARDSDFDLSLRAKAQQNHARYRTARGPGRPGQGAIRSGIRGTAG